MSHLPHLLLKKSYIEVLVFFSLFYSTQKCNNNKNLTSTSLLLDNASRHISVRVYAWRRTASEYHGSAREKEQHQAKHSCTHISPKILAYLKWLIATLISRFYWPAGGGDAKLLRTPPSKIAFGSWMDHVWFLNPPIKYLVGIVSSII